MATPPQPLQPGQKPSPQQIAMMQQQLAAEAAKNNMSVEQYVAQLKANAMRQHQQQQQSQQAAAKQQQQQQQQQQMPINPGPPDPKSLAVAKWLRSQDLKTRTCILGGQRKDLFKVKRALRALQSPAYSKASSKKNSPLPPVTDRTSAENTFKLLPLSLLALRVNKIDPHEGHAHDKPKKRVKGLWTVKVEQQQEVRDELHFVWLYEGPQWKTKLYAGGALAAIMAVVMFPLWPIKMRLGVWYLSMGMLGLIGLFFAMAFFRLILFAVTMFAVPPGLWLYPNLFEDVGFFDSFRPIWGWQEEKKKKKSKKGKAADGNEQPTSEKSSIPSPSGPISAGITSSATSPSAAAAAAGAHRRDLKPRIEEVEDE
ncbi:MAG: Translocation protein S62 [Pycnora praestabilis]|nr:MAG: Translocation protein S62 [Pycnora praestabilis]